MAPHDHTVIELSDDEDDESQLQRAIALSLGRPPPNKAGTSAAATMTADKKTSSSFGLHQLDRKQMEAERLARLERKRKLVDQPGPLPPPHKTKRHHQPSIFTPKAIVAEDSKAPSRSYQTDRTDLPFAKGVVKRTWAHGYERRGDDIKIEEILQKEELELAMMTSFQWDTEWLLKKIDLRRTKVVFVAYAQDETQEDQNRANAPNENVRFCFPPMDGGGYLHAKLQLLRFPNYLRIVVPSANLTDYDWGETGVLENVVFLIDLPNDPKGMRAQQTSFGRELSRFLRALGLEDQLISGLDKYDFTETKNFTFVHSICGTHTADDLKHTGFYGLSQAVRDLDLATQDPIEVDFVCSSLGSLKTAFLTSLYRAFQGQVDNEADGRCPTDKKPKSRGAASGSRNSSNPGLLDKFRIYYPSQKTVAGCRGGTASAGTITFKSAWWKSDTFPRTVWRDCVSRRERILVHSKIGFVRPSLSRRKCPGWVYVGSANLSESAWGRVQVDRASKTPKLICRNWECGVLLKAPDLPSTTTRHLGDVAEDFYRIFDDRVPVPMEFLPTPTQSAASSTLLPWFRD